MYKNQPGRIEDYVPGKSSVVDKEAKQVNKKLKDVNNHYPDTHTSSRIATMTKISVE